MAESRENIAMKVMVASDIHLGTVVRISKVFFLNVAFSF